MAQSSETKLNKIFDQNIEITGNLTVDGNLVGFSGDNFYLDGITKSGNTLTFSVNGTTNQTYTFGSAAFANTTAFAAASHSHPYLSNDSDSEQTVGSKINYFNSGGLRMNMDPRWNEGGYDGDNGNLHIWSTKANGGNYGRAGLALYNGSAYQYLTTKGGQNALYHNNNEIITSSSIGSQSVNYANSAGTVSGTQLGADSQGLTAFTSATAWSKPAGYQTMIRADQTTGDPGGQNYYGYTITSRRDTGTGYSALLTGYNNNDLWFTYNNTETNYPTWRRVWTEVNDGSGSGLDADLLDGIQGSSFLRSDADDTVSNGVTYTWNGTDTHGLRFVNSSYNKELRIGGWSASNSAGISRIRNSNDNLHLDSGSAGIILLNHYSGGNVGTNNGGGYFYSYTSMRSPIFYDYNNTGYYLNPEGTNRIYELYANDVTSTERQASPRWDTAFYVLQAQHWYGDNSTQTMYLGEDNYIHLRDNVEVTDDIRSPIYYDRDDTTYYTNPASTSNMNVVTSANDVVDDEVLFAVTDYDTTESLRLKFNGGSQLTKIDDPDAPASGVFKVQGSFNPTMGPYMPMDDETEVIFECWAKHDSGSDTAGLFYCGSNFYDGSKGYYGNTQRYWGASSDAQDANDTGWRHIKGSFKGSTIRAALSDASYFRFIVLFNYQSNGNATRFCGFKFYRSKKTVSSLWVKRGVNDTAFQSTEAATAHQVISNNADVFPKSLLEMPAHSGVMKFRTNTHWESNPGIDFIGTGGEFRMSSDTGNLNLRVDGWIISHDDIRAAIFYDNTDTNYYLHPNGTSRINRIDYTELHSPSSNNNGRFLNHSSWGTLHQTDHGYIQLGPANTGHAHIYTDRSNFYFNVDTDAATTYARNSSRAPIFYDSNDTSRYVDPNSTSVLSGLILHNHLRIPSGHGRGVRFWDSDSYKIHMSASSQSTHGGRVSGETSSDYNMYFTMSGGTNRGFVFRNSNSASSCVAGIDGVGTIRTIGDVIAYASSDKRLKDNITPIDNPIDKVQNISGVTFDWNDKQDTYEHGKHDVGVIAQEIEEVLPEVVDTRENGYKAVKYEKIVPLLIEAIKEQQKQIDELKKLINP